MKTILCITMFATLVLSQEPAPPAPPAAPVPVAEPAPFPEPVPVPDPPLAPLPPLLPREALRAQIRAGVNVGITTGITEMTNGIIAGVIGGIPRIDIAFQVRDRDRDRANEQAEREYERASRALDKRQWDEAVTRFNEVAVLGKAKADGALYWKAYALSKLGRSKEAIAALDELGKTHPQSRWLNDTKALRVEIGQAQGKPVSPEDATDDDIKLMAIQALMQSDPERSMPLLEKLLFQQSSPKLRERALFVLSENNSPKAREIVARVAKGSTNPDLQMKAVRNLGVYGGKENRQLLAEVYAASNDVAIKKQVLNSYMVSGERDRLFAVAKSDSNPELRASAIRYLGNMGANSQLAELYSSESSTEVRARILQSIFETGNIQKLIEVARTEKDPELRERAIRHLGHTGSPAAGDALVSIYIANNDLEVRKRVMRSLSEQNNARQLIEVTRKETNPELRKEGVRRLTDMRSKEAMDFLTELLK